MRTSNPDFEKNTLNPYVVRPDEVANGDRYGYKVIAVIDEWAHMWRAYRGPTGWDDDRVAREGDAISEEVADILFPSLTQSGRSYSN